MDDSVSGFDVQGETNGLIALQYGLEGTSRVLVRHGCCLLTVRVGACAHPQDKDGKVQASVPEALGYDTLEELIHDYNTIRKSFRDKCYKERRRLQASVARAAGTPAPPPPPAPTPAADEVTVVCRPWWCRLALLCNCRRALAQSACARGHMYSPGQPSTVSSRPSPPALRRGCFRAPQTPCTQPWAALALCHLPTPPVLRVPPHLQAGQVQAAPAEPAIGGAALELEAPVVNGVAAAPPPADGVSAVRRPGRAVGPCFGGRGSLRAPAGSPADPVHTAPGSPRARALPAPTACHPPPPPAGRPEGTGRSICCTRARDRRRRLRRRPPARRRRGRGIRDTRGSRPAGWSPTGRGGTCSTRDARGECGVQGASRRRGLACQAGRTAASVTSAPGHPTTPADLACCPLPPLGTGGICGG
jgi:hypothetical protein